MSSEQNAGTGRSKTDSSDSSARRIRGSDIMSTTKTGGTVKAIHVSATTSGMTVHAEVEFPDDPPETVLFLVTEPKFEEQFRDAKKSGGTVEVDYDANDPNNPQTRVTWR